MARRDDAQSTVDARLIRHPRPRAQRASKDERPLKPELPEPGIVQNRSRLSTISGPSPIEARPSAERLRVTGQTLIQDKTIMR
jgi:hypothetical protein